MAFDLAISGNGDLIISGARDLQGVSGVPLLEQRMLIRLRIARGSWIYDTDGSLGSTLFSLLHESPDEVSDRAPAIVREALRGMENEISIDDVEASVVDDSLVLVIGYRVAEITDGVGGGGVVDYTDPLTFTVSIPVSG